MVLFLPGRKHWRMGNGEYFLTNSQSLNPHPAFSAAGVCCSPHHTGSLCSSLSSKWKEQMGVKFQKIRKIKKSVPGSQDAWPHWAGSRHLLSLPSSAFWPSFLSPYVSSLISFESSSLVKSFRSRLLFHFAP